MGNFAENLNLGNRFRPPRADVANSKRPQRVRVDFQLRVRTNAVRVKMKLHGKVNSRSIDFA